MRVKNKALADLNKKRSAEILAKAAQAKKEKK